LKLKHASETKMKRTRLTESTTSSEGCKKEIPYQPSMGAPGHG